MNRINEFLGSQTWLFVLKFRKKFKKNGSLPTLQESQLLAGSAVDHFMFCTKAHAVLYAIAKKN